MEDGNMTISFSLIVNKKIVKTTKTLPRLLKYVYKKYTNITHLTFDTNKGQFYRFKDKDYVRDDNGNQIYWQKNLRE